MEEVGKGHYLGMKCLFEMIGLYPGDRGGGRSCGRFRRPRRCCEGWFLGTSQCRNQSYQRFHVGHGRIRGCSKMKASSWATAANRLSASFDSDSDADSTVGGVSFFFCTGLSEWT